MGIKQARVEAVVESLNAAQLGHLGGSSINPARLRLLLFPIVHLFGLFYGYPAMGMTFCF